MNHQIKIPSKAWAAFEDAFDTPIDGADYDAGFAAMLAALAPEELRELASSLLTMANGLERDAHDDPPWDDMHSSDRENYLAAREAEETEQEAPDRGQVSDGSHTFDELYAHRRALTAALTALLPGWSWRSRAHHPDDTEIFPGYFIVGISLPNGVITYHYRDQYWNDFPRARELAHAPKWDGAEPGITVSRLIDMARS